MTPVSFEIPNNARSWSDLFGLLRALGSLDVASLAERYPKYRSEIFGEFEPSTKDLAGLGDAQVRASLGRSAIEAAVDPTQRSLEDALSITQRKIRAFARIRMGSGAISLIGSAGVLAALPLAAGVPAVVSGLVASIASSMNLWTSYYEDQDGGIGKIRILREKLLEQVGVIAMVKSKLSLGHDAQSDVDIIALMSSLNLVAGELQKARIILEMNTNMEFKPA